MTIRQRNFGSSFLFYSTEMFLDYGAALLKDTFFMLYSCVIGTVTTKGMFLAT